MPSEVKLGKVNTAPSPLSVWFCHLIFSGKTYTGSSEVAEGGPIGVSGLVDTGKGGGESININCLLHPFLVASEDLSCHSH